MKLLTVDKAMKFDLQLDMPFAGYSTASCKPGEKVWIVQKEFVSSEDGDLFISRLEGIPLSLLNKVAQKHGIFIAPSSVDNMLAILRQDASATIHINSPMKALMQVKRAVEAGQAIYRNDIADIRELVFDRIEIPDNVGVMVLFSVGWRKGLFYDLLSPSSQSQKRDYDLSQLLGGYYSYLSFQERFKISDSEWQALLENGWFPFVTLNNDLINSIVSHNRKGWNVDDLLPSVKEDVLKRLPDGLKTWAKMKAFEPHMDFISKAAQHYVNDDPISCISVLFPRIEGIMRAFQTMQGQPEKAKQKDLASTVLSPSLNLRGHQFSPLLPLRFHQYLTNVYFANFDPASSYNALSRNTVGHGVATKENFDLKGATLGLLILDQLSYYFCGIT